MGSFIQLTAADGHGLGAYLAKAEGQRKAALVVAQEIFGVNGHIRSVCDRFAGQGYDALAPALFDRVKSGIELGYGPEDIAEGRGYKDQISWSQAANDIAAAHAHLADTGPVGIVGYCWGGSVAWLGATEGGFAGAVGYYGGQIAALSDRRPRCPVLLHFGERDAGIPLGDVDAVAEAHPEVTIHVYQGADHGFNCDQRASYDKASAETALDRTLAFFAEHLTGDR